MDTKRGFVDTTNTNQSREELNISRSINSEEETDHDYNGNLSARD